MNLLTIVAHKNVALLFDEMKIKERFVFRKDGTLVGFVNLGDINTSLKALEANVNKDYNYSPKLATHMLTLMVQRIFMYISFPFSTKG